MIDYEDVPQWLVYNVENIDQIISKTEMVKKLGQAETKRGLEKIEKADELLCEMNYLRGVFTKDHANEIWNDTIISGSATGIKNQLDFVNNDFKIILEKVNYADTEDIKAHNFFLDTVSSTDGSTDTAVYLGASIEKRIQAISPSYTPSLLELEPKILSSRETILSDLISILRPFGEKYVAMVKGSEVSISSDDPDSFSQGAHSMRDCFEDILKELAPSKIVKSQPWFEETPRAPGKVSRRSRLRYILYGSGENIDHSEIERFDGIAAIAKDALDICINRAHDHDPSLKRGEVRLAIDHARKSLLKILKLYNEFRNT